MKGWVGLVGWPIADGLPTLVVTHQLQVERRTGKVRQSRDRRSTIVPREHWWDVWGTPSQHIIDVAVVSFGHCRSCGGQRAMNEVSAVSAWTRASALSQINQTLALSSNASDAADGALLGRFADLHCSTHSFIPDLKPSFSANLPTAAFPFLLQDWLHDSPDCLLLLLSISVFTF